MTNFCQTCGRQKGLHFSVLPACTCTTAAPFYYPIQPKREWVGLTMNEAKEFYEKYTDRAELINALDKFLEAKNA
jgi:hypothetical protein